MTEVTILRLTQPTHEGYVFTREMFKPHLVSNSELSQRLKDGQVFGYIGEMIDENICAKFNAIFISDGYVMGTVEPFGPHASSMTTLIESRQAIEFTLRALVQLDPRNPSLAVGINRIVGFGLVNAVA